MKKSVLAVLISIFALILPLHPLHAQTQDFSDVPESHWAHSYISFLAENDIASGYGDGTFGPERSITRAEVTKIALTTANLTVSRHLEPVLGLFPALIDVPENHSLKKYVRSALIDFIPPEDLDPYPNSSAPSLYFYPERPASRIFTLKLLLDASGFGDAVDEYKSQNPTSSFVDVTSPEEIAYTGYAKQLGIIQGYGDGRFGPNDSVRRSEMAKIIRNTVSAFNEQKGTLRATVTYEYKCGEVENFDYTPFSGEQEFQIYKPSSNAITRILAEPGSEIVVDLLPGEYVMYSNGYAKFTIARRQETVKDISLVVDLVRVLNTVSTDDDTDVPECIYSPPVG